MNLKDHTVDQFLASLEALRLAELDQQMKRVRKNLDGVTKLVEAGFTVDVDEHNVNYVCLFCEQKDLTRVYSTLGRLRVLSTDILDAKQKTVNVCLIPDKEKYPNVYIWYIRKLPRKAKCKIVSRRVTKHQLVCEV